MLEVRQYCTHGGKLIMCTFSLNLGAYYNHICRCKLYLVLLSYDPWRELVIRGITMRIADAPHRYRETLCSMGNCQWSKMTKL